MERNENKVYTLEQAVYMYLRDKKKKENYIGISFEEMEMQKDDVIEDNAKSLYDKFRIDYKNENNIFNDILRIFRIADSFTACKKMNGGYQFDEEDMEFIAELLYRYHGRKKVWLDIQKVKNDEFDGFIQIYKGKNGRQLIEELEFVINGFLDIYAKNVGKESRKYTDFENELYIATQYKKIQMIQEMERLFFDTISFSKEDALFSRCGMLLGVYQKQLESVRISIKNILDRENAWWNFIKGVCKEDFIASNFTEATEKVMGHLIEEMKDIDLQAGEEFEKVYNNESGETISGKEERSLGMRVSKVFKKAFGKLSEYEQKELLQSIFGGHLKEISDLDKDMMQIMICNHVRNMLEQEKVEGINELEDFEELDEEVLQSEKDLYKFLERGIFR